MRRVGEVQTEQEEMEIEVDNEERKIEVDSERRVEAERKLDDAENPFLDSFYSLSAPNPKERSRAAQVMLSHCLLGPSANSKDAAYAFRRLLNGLCSGRAAARQGNASALASFLKIAFQLDKMEEIRSEHEDNRDENPSSMLNYVRGRLLSATDPQKMQGKKKGAEVRDYQFARLFGILAVVRSRILLLPGDDNEIREVASSLVSDLIELFWERRWIREPAAHGVTSMLNLFFGSNRKASQKIGWHLVKEVIVPKVLIIMQDDRSEESDFETLIKKYCAEQIGIAAYIQSQSQSNNLPFPLDEPIISTKTIAWIRDALSETSAIVQPRTHFVWDTLWCYLTEKTMEKNPSEKDTDSAPSSSKYCTRKTVPIGEDSVVDVVDGIMKLVVQEKLLGIEKNTSKTTHERKSLALCIVRNLSGVPFVSSVSGPTQIVMHTDAIENVILTKDIIRYLFLDVISAGKEKQDTSHLLKPLALKVLGSWVESAVQSGDANRQLACLKAITNCNPQFDNLTKTTTISELLLTSSGGVSPAAQYELWGKYFAHLESKFLDLCSSTEDTSTEAHKYIQLMYTSAKHILHKSNEGEEDQGAESSECKKIVTKRVLGFFMSTAFFDCSTVKKDTKSKREKKGASTFPSVQTITESALKVKASLQDGQKIAYPTRVMISSMFFALVSEVITTISHDSKTGENAKVEKDSILLTLLEEIYEEWIELESNQAKRFVPVEDVDDDEEDDDDSPEHIIKELRSKVVALRETSGSDEEAKKRCITGITALTITLHLHRLSCGSDDEMDDNPDADEEEDEENICNAIADLDGVASDFLQSTEVDSNPLLGLSEICTNILSSPLGSGELGRGAAPKIVREAVKYAWIGGLKLASSIATQEKTLLDDTVIDSLMDAIGASISNDDQSEMDDDGDDDEDDDESNGESDDDMVFSKASKVLDDDEDMEDQDEENSEGESDDSDIELDPSKLHTMLEDDNLDDVDDIPLEHHEGADAALAKLIKLKQEARKAGREAREKIEVSNQLRCTLLLDTLFLRPDSWNKLFQSNVLLKMIVPLLERRKRVGISTQRAFEGGGKPGAGNKKELLQRLTQLIKKKISKIRLSSMPLTSPIDVDSATKSFELIMKEAKTSKDKEHLSCCSSSLIFLLRLMPKSPELVSFVSTEYGHLVSDWATKRDSGASLVEDLISQMPALAQASLSSSLSGATQVARGFFLKLEAYRLLSLLFANKLDSEGGSKMERIALAKIHESQDDLLNAINKTLNDDETIKPKLAKAAFKTLEKMLPFISPPASSDALDLLTAMKVEISSLGTKHADLNGAAEKLAQQIDSRREALSAASAKSGDATQEKKVSQSGKKSKKKKKKKR